jgi:hypothetical protein
MAWNAVRPDTRSTSSAAAGSPSLVVEGGVASVQTVSSPTLTRASTNVRTTTSSDWRGIVISRNWMPEFGTSLHSARNRLSPAALRSSPGFVSPGLSITCGLPSAASLRLASSSMAFIVVGDHRSIRHPLTDVSYGGMHQLRQHTGATAVWLRKSTQEPKPLRRQGT